MDSLSVMLELFTFKLKSLVFTSSAKFYDLNGRACILNYRLPKTRSFSSEIRNNLFHSWGAFLPSTADDRDIVQGIEVGLAGAHLSSPPGLSNYGK